MCCCCFLSSRSCLKHLWQDCTFDDLAGSDKLTAAMFEEVADRVAGMEKPVKCASPFVASGGAVCAATRQQVARVCVAALEGGPRYSRRVIEVVTRPEVADDGTMRVDGTMARTLG